MSCNLHYPYEAVNPFQIVSDRLKDGRHSIENLKNQQDFYWEVLMLKPQISIRGEAGCKHYPVNVAMCYPAFSFLTLRLKPKVVNNLFEGLILLQSLH